MEIVLIGHKLADPTTRDNSPFLGLNAEFRRFSPFRRDRAPDSTLPRWVDPAWAAQL